MSASGSSRDVTSVCTPDVTGHCTLCGDDAAEAVVLAVDAVTRLAVVRLGGGSATIALDLLDGAGVTVGDRVLVHQGFAIGRLERGVSHGLEGVP